MSDPQYIENYARGTVRSDAGFCDAEIGLPEQSMQSELLWRKFNLTVWIDYYFGWLAPHKAQALPSTAPIDSQTR